MLFHSPTQRSVRKRERPTIRIGGEAFDPVEELGEKMGLYEIEAGGK